MDRRRIRDKLRDLYEELGPDDDDGGGPPADGGPPRDGGRDDEFPPAGIDLVHHDLRVRLDVGGTGTGDETVKLFGKMLIRRDDPYTNEDGFRQIDFRVMSWEAAGWSWILKQNLTYVLSEDVEQPVSAIVAEQEGSDYPARFEFNVIFDVRADNLTVFRRHHGRPYGHGFMVVPPNGNRRLSPTIRSFEDARVSVEHPLLGSLFAIPIDCNDQKSETLATL
ncbi:MAG: hypothetical protein M3271_05330 [Actinomycetota bacterium]|nr:hypothetical protein [Actinomycetota bacterium]